MNSLTIIKLNSFDICYLIFINKNHIFYKMAELKKLMLITNIVCPFARRTAILAR